VAYPVATDVFVAIVDDHCFPGGIEANVLKSVRLERTFASGSHHQTSLP